MKIGIIACESFKKELDFLTQNNPNIVYKEYLEFGLHGYPQDLKRTVVEKVNSLQGKVDAVLLGYGICNSLREITGELKVPTVRLDGDDCIGVILTSSEYEKERKKCAGTFYMTPYFAERGLGLEEMKSEFAEKIPNYEELGIDLKWYLDRMFDGYSRVLYVDDGLGDSERLITLSKQTANELNLDHQCRMGTLSVLIDGLARVYELAQENCAHKVIRSPPLVSPAGL
jgi:hypothetical protein